MRRHDPRPFARDITCTCWHASEWKHAACWTTICAWRNEYVFVSRGQTAWHRHTGSGCAGCPLHDTSSAAQSAASSKQSTGAGGWKRKRDALTQRRSTTRGQVLARSSRRIQSYHGTGYKYFATGRVYKYSSYLVCDIQRDFSWLDIPRRAYAILR